MSKKVNSKPKKISIQNKGKKPKKSIKQIMIFDRFLVISLAATLLFTYGLFNYPITYQKTEVHDVDYATQYKDEASIEIGTENVSKVGIIGKQQVTYKHTQSLFDYIFNREKSEKEEVESKIIAEPIAEVIQKGTLKYQFMLCSDGSYRSYSDEQFKDRNIGFTSKSPDYCAENNQGTKLRLSDSPNRTQSASPATNSPQSDGWCEEIISGAYEFYLDNSKIMREYIQNAINDIDSNTSRSDSVKKEQVNNLVKIYNEGEDSRVSAWHGHIRDNGCDNKKMGYELNPAYMPYR